MQDSGRIPGSEGDSSEGAEHDARDDTMNSTGAPSQSGKCDEAHDDEENQASLEPATAQLSLTSCDLQHVKSCWCHVKFACGLV